MEKLLALMRDLPDSDYVGNVLSYADAHQRTPTRGCSSQEALARRRETGHDHIWYGFWKIAESHPSKKAPSFQCEKGAMILNFPLL